MEPTTGAGWIWQTTEGFGLFEHGLNFVGMSGFQLSVFQTLKTGNEKLRPRDSGRGF